MRLHRLCRCVLTLSIFAGILSLGSSSTWADDFITVAERTNFVRTSSYDETADFYRRLDSASEFASLQVFGKTPQGRDLQCLVVSNDRAFTPAAAHATGKVILLIQNGIHAGEIEGKDASMILLRDVLITKERTGILDSVILLVIPIINPDGHENTRRYTRSNQYGPENAGFRTTAQRYNLNRDYMKADAVEMRAWLRLWHTWLPDFFIDDHVTDGQDWQHVIAYTISWHPNAAPELRAWTRQFFDPEFMADCRQAGYPAFPYAFPIRDDFRGAYGTYVDSPRLSTGYTTLWNRPGLLIEMHSLKDYKTRVLGNRAALLAVTDVLYRHKSALKGAIASADSATIAGLHEPYPFSFEPDGDSTMREILTYSYRMDSSKVTGGKYARWDHKSPTHDTIPFFGSFRAKLTVVPPRAYIIQREWTEQIAKLALHGVAMGTLREPATLNVQYYHLDSVSWGRESYEGNVRASYKVTRRDTTITYPAGTVIVDLHQRPARVAIQALEPEGPDSFIAWGFWNTIFEQKEYMESYMADPLADSLYASDPRIRAEFDAKVAADTAFAKSVDAKRDFFYKHSSFAEDDLRFYPVTRLLTAPPPVVSWESSDGNR